MNIKCDYVKSNMMKMQNFIIWIQLVIWIQTASSFMQKQKNL